MTDADDDDDDGLQGRNIILKCNNSFGNRSTIVQLRVVMFVKCGEAACKLSM